MRLNNTLLAVLTLAALLVAASRAWAQSDVEYQPIARRGDYLVRVLPALDGTPTALVCLKRVDVVPAEVLGCSPATPGVEVVIPISVPVTPNDDAEVRAFAYDYEDMAVALESEPSANAGVLIFTPPRGPILK